MQSKTRKQRRKDKPAAKGKVMPIHKRKVKADKTNAGGFYEGMPGVVLDQYGNRKMIEFTVTPQGVYTALIHAHPRLCKAAIQDAMNNPMIKGVVHSAVLDQVFSRKTIWNWLLRLRLKLSLHIHHKKQERKLKEAMEKQLKQLNDGQEKNNTIKEANQQKAVTKV